MPYHYRQSVIGTGGERVTEFIELGRRTESGYIPVCSQWCTQG